MNLRRHPCNVAPAEGPEKYGPNRPTRSGSSCRRTAPRSTASRGRNTRLRTYLTPPSTEPFSQPFAGAQNSARNGYAPRNAANATGATQRRGHEENWEFETHRVAKQWASASTAQYSRRSNVTSPEQGVRPPWFVAADERPQDVLRHCSTTGPVQQRARDNVLADLSTNPPPGSSSSCGGDEGRHAPSLL